MVANPSRLILARKRRGLTKVALGRKADVSSKSVSLYEQGAKSPSEKTLASLARALEFSVEFLSETEDLLEISPDRPSFRSHSRMKASQRDSSLALGTLGFALNSVLEEEFRLPQPDVPDLSEMPPENAALALRAEWGLGESAVKNMVNLLEAKGVRVFSLADDCVEVDAFMVWNGETPFVFLNTMKSGERGRFDAAHELGHLVLHRDQAAHGREAEQEANRFASAFLMPENSITAHAPGLPSLHRLVRLKKRWAVSVGALAHRLRALDLMTEWQYRNACIQISKNGWRKEEPEGIERETSQLLVKSMTLLSEDGRGSSYLAGRLKIPPEELNKLMFGKLIHGLAGEGHGNTVTVRSHLRLVD